MEKKGKGEREGGGRREEGSGRLLKPRARPQLAECSPSRVFLVSTILHALTPPSISAEDGLALLMSPPHLAVFCEFRKFEGQFGRLLGQASLPPEPSLQLLLMPENVYCA